MGNKKILITFCFLVLSFYFLGCAPRVAPPPLYKEADLSLAEIIEATGKKDIVSLKAITDIKVTVDGRPHSDVSSSAILMKPGMAHIRAYKLGILIGDIVIRDGEAHVRSGKVSDKVKEFSKDLYVDFFWWDDMQDADIFRREGEYLLKKEGKEMILDSATLLPISQKIKANGRDIFIMYSQPAKANDFWYQSFMEIALENYIFTVKVDKLRLNPEIREGEFSTEVGPP
jgi:hypothetical protein